MGENQMTIEQEAQAQIDTKNRVAMIERMTCMLETKKDLEEKLASVAIVISDLEVGKTKSYYEFRNRQSGSTY